MSPDKKVRGYTPQLSDAEDEILLKLAELQDALYEKRVKIEHIKIDMPLTIGGHEVTNLNGVDIKTVIYEDDATHWKRQARGNDLSAASPESKVKA